MIIFRKPDNNPNFSENIYQLVQLDMSEKDKEKRYQSKYHSASKELHYAPKSLIPRSMGPLHTPLKSPKEYLKKHSSEPKIESSKSMTCLCRKKSKSKPPLPNLKEDPPILWKHDKRNFIEENTVKAMRSPPTIPLQKMADTEKGDSFVVEESGVSQEFKGCIEKILHSAIDDRQSPKSPTKIKSRRQNRCIAAGHRYDTEKRRDFSWKLHMRFKLVS
ncbi:enkurin [Caerostris darwini]|uniref:Enkurin n=1 Tax=Caerostris darwini TaxID=1538125 RepID=A0AAV4UJX9_9ARAC|nr:enkurin [Caerostris darwini]